ncbi:MAG TPA: TRAP transporter substrate-binding protein [Paraburkholderia sp.]|uniref:TRAP transporter substrate-binding protein n=1 Tax=Paraburkholderia sp. TaxID=1926495 RepID=UPI002C9D74FF|nr:TRAP transporter substrate-binding protein [Paraburkholderia sp.]HTR05445.1 TRAP transporter substrate-binding protein [Paraburkholderia sp.]
MKLGNFIAGLCLSVIALNAAAQQPIIIKFSHVVASDTPKGKAADYFKKLAEARTKGRVKVEVYPNSQLYKDKEELEALQLGSVQMLAPSLAKFGPLGAKEFELFDLPYIFDNYADLHKVTDGPIGKRLMSGLEPRGITGLAYWDNGFKVMTSNRPLRVPADFRGQKMRIQSSKVLDSQFRALGAIPQVMAFSEVYQALQTGVVDGTENTPSNIYTQRMNEVQKYLTLSDHGYIGYAVIVNRKFWDGLPADLRTTLEGAMRDATTYANNIARQENDDALAKIKATGKTEFITLTPEQKADWVKALSKVHREQESRIGRDLIQDVYRATGKTL